MSDLNKLASHLMRPREKRAASQDLTSFLSGRRADRESPEQLVAATEFFHSMKHAGVGDTNDNVSNKEMLNARLTNSLEGYEKQKERLLPASYKAKQKTLAGDHAGNNDHDHNLCCDHVVDQLQGIVAKTDDSIKEARIFGAGKPDGLDISAVPYKSRKAKFERYLSRKSSEEPTPIGTAVGTGLLAGGALGVLAGSAGGGAGAAMGGIVGGATGAFIGAAFAAADGGEIRRAKRILAKGGIDDAMANEIVNQRRSQEYSAERRTDSRHRELIGAIRAPKSDYGSPSRSRRYKYAGAKGDEARARLKGLLADYRDKIEAEQSKEAFISYAGKGLGLHLPTEDAPKGEQSGWKNYLGVVPPLDILDAEQILAEKMATGRNYLASAGAGGALGAYKSLRSDSEERKQDRLLSDLGAMPKDVLKKRQNRRLAKTVGSGVAGAAAGAAAYGGGKRVLPKLKKTMIDDPINHAAKRFGEEGQSIVDKAKVSLDDSIQKGVDRNVDEVGKRLSKAKDDFSIGDLLRKKPSAPAASGTSGVPAVPAGPKKKWFRSKSDKYKDFADGKIDKLAAPVDYVGAGGGAVVGGIAAYRKAVKLRDTRSEWDSPDSKELGVKDKFVRAVNRDAAKHPGVAALGGILGGAASGHAIQRGVTAPFRRF